MVPVIVVAALVACTEPTAPDGGGPGGGDSGADTADGGSGVADTGAPDTAGDGGTDGGDTAGDGGTDGGGTDGGGTDGGGTDGGGTDGGGTDGGGDCDADDDGYLATDCGGEDCDDTDPDVNPGADELRTWSEEVLDTTTETISGLSLALDADDHPHASWVLRDSESLRYAFRSDDDWAVETLADDALCCRTAVVHGVDQTFVAYNAATLAVMVGEGGVWTTEPVDSADSAVTYLGAATDLDGRLTLVFPGEDLVVAVRDPAGWTDEEIVLADSAGGRGLAMAIDHDGAIHITQNGVIGADAYQAEHITNASGSWVAASMGPAGTNTETDIAVDLDGNLHVTWNRYVSTVGYLYYGNDRTGSLTSETIPTGGDRAGAWHGVDLAVDSAGTATVGFRHFDDAPYKLLENETGEWELTDLGDSDQYEGDVAVDSDGYRHVLVLDPTHAQVSYWTDGVGDGIDHDCDGVDR